MNLLSLLRRRPREPVRPSPAPAPAGNPEDRPGCGWFDSSHDLHHGLRVHEHTDPDALARELPLANWLDLQLGTWRTAQPQRA